MPIHNIRNIWLCPVTGDMRKALYVNRPSKDIRQEIYVEILKRVIIPTQSPVREQGLRKAWHVNMQEQDIRQKKDSRKALYVNMPSDTN